MATVNLGFENNLWDMADKLRGNIEASEYKHVVLGLIFLKYISDAFEERYNELVAEGDDFEEDIDAYTEENVFFVPKEARWEYIKANAKQPTIGQIIDEAMIAIEKENASLKGVLPKNYARPEIDKTKLGELIDLFSFKVGDKEARAKDVLGRVYEYFLGKFGSSEGEFYTPPSIVKLLVEMIEPYKGRVYDPCCGSGGMFVQSQRFVEEHSGRKDDIHIFGQEYTATTWRLCKMNLAIRGLVDCIITLPPNLFYNVTIPACLWFLTKNKKSAGRDRSNEILFIDARKMGTMVDRKHRELDYETEIKYIADTYHKWKKGEGYEDIKGFCKSATLDEVRSHEYILTPGRYVGIEERVDDGEPFDEKMTRLTGELAEMFAKRSHLEEEIRKRLGAIGYEF